MDAGQDGDVNAAANMVMRSHDALPHSSTFLYHSVRTTFLSASPEYLSSLSGPYPQHLEANTQLW
jgi:isochorismate synthase EntC